MRLRLYPLAIVCVLVQVAASEQADQNYVTEFVMPELLDVVPTLTVQQRDRDFFGFVQHGDPVAAVAEAAAEASAARDEIEKPTLATALQYLPVAGIDPVNREFFVGARSIFQGDRLILNHAGEQFHAEVVEVRNRQITMEDRDTGLRASIRIDLVPPDEWDHPSITQMGE